MTITQNIPITTSGKIEITKLPDHTQLPESESDSGKFEITKLPDHTQLPESDGTFGQNFQAFPQSILSEM